MNRPIAPAFLGFATVAISFGVLLGRFDAPDASAATPKLQQFSGTIASVDHLSHAVIVERRLWGVSIGEPTTVVLDAQTELQGADGKPLNLSHLEAGQRVTVNYYDDSGRQVARSITVKDSTQHLPVHSAGPPNQTEVPAPTPEATPSQEQPSTLPPDV
jgi:hypothetical protein